MKKQIYVLGFLFFVSLLYSIFITKKYFDLMPPSQSIIQKKENCKVETVTQIVDGVSMEPLIKNGTILELLKNYYDCEGVVTRGDLVFFDSIITPTPVIKKISVLPGDRVVFKNGNMLLNGEVFKNSAGDVYVFSEKEIQTMTPFVKTGVMQTGSYFLFGDNISQSIDSRVYGGVGSNDFKGKFRFEKK